MEMFLVRYKDKYQHRDTLRSGTLHHLHTPVEQNQFIFTWHDLHNRMSHISSEREREREGERERDIEQEESERKKEEWEVMWLRLHIFVNLDVQYIHDWMDTFY